MLLGRELHLLVLLQRGLLMGRSVLLLLVLLLLVLEVRCAEGVLHVMVRRGGHRWGLDRRHNVGIEVGGSERI